MADKDKPKNNQKEDKPEKAQNKDTGITRGKRDIGRHADRGKKKDKEKSINEMGGTGGDSRSEERSRGDNQGNKRDDRRDDQRRRRREEEKGRQEDEVAQKREKEARDKKVEDLRNRRKAVQHYMKIAENSDNPLEEINWGDKNLKSKDRRKLRQILDSRGFDDKEVFKSEKKDLNKRIRDNKKDNLKTGASLAGDVTSMVGTGGASAILGIPKVIINVFKMRRNKKENEKLKKSMRWRRFLLILPTLLIALGLLVAGWLIITVGSQFAGTMLSHPEAIRELYDAGVLGDALYMGNVTEDVVVDGEVIVKGNPNAQPGCFEYNGVWYCGGCLSTGGVEASSNIEVGGSGEVTGEMGEPMKPRYRITSNYGSRWGNVHRGIDLVGQGGELGIYAADGGKVSFVRDVCAPNSGFYPNRDPVCGGWGNYVVITHEGQPYKKTLYAHFNYVHVKEGDLVDKGQQLGIMGHTGNSTGAHLHFEVWESNEYGSQVDPRKYVPSFPASGQMKQ